MEIGNAEQRGSAGFVGQRCWSGRGLPAAPGQTHHSTRDAWILGAPARLRGPRHSQRLPGQQGGPAGRPGSRCRPQNLGCKATTEGRCRRQGARWRQAAAVPGMQGRSCCSCGLRQLLRASCARLALIQHADSCTCAARMPRSGGRQAHACTCVGSTAAARAEQGSGQGCGAAHACSWEATALHASQTATRPPGSPSLSLPWLFADVRVWLRRVKTQMIEWIAKRNALDGTGGGHQNGEEC